MSKDVTILRAIRERSTIVNEIATAQERATKNAVSFEGNDVDFKAEEQLATYVAKQHELRALKVAVLEASLKHTVTIPENLGIPESGQKVSVHQAILIRDDLKGYKKLIDSISKIDNSPGYTGGIYAMREGKEPQKRVRNFDFNKMLSDIEKLQTAIDEIDAAIQFVDSTKKVSI